MSGQSPIHATCVAVDGRGILIIGPSSCGKSSLALQLIALGAELVSDDRTILTEVDGKLIATAPDTIKGLIEARGIGILNATFAPEADLSVVVDLDKFETERIPIEREVTILGIELPLLHRVEGLHFAAGVLQFVRGGRSKR